MSNAAAAQWVKFFNAAGIPSPAAASYAHIFVENRIQNDMLMDLNKEYLREMGITLMGDIIAILRHAKNVSDQTARDKVLTHSDTHVPIASVKAHSHSSQERPTTTTKVKLKSVPVISSTSSTMSSHAYNKSSEDKAASQSKTVRRVLPEHEGKYKIKLPSGTTKRSKEILAKHEKLYSERESTNKRTHVFDRLTINSDSTIDLAKDDTDDEVISSASSKSVISCNEDDTVMRNVCVRITGICGSNEKTSVNSSSSSIFSRLGRKTKEDSDDGSTKATQIKPILKNSQKPVFRSAIVKAKTSSVSTPARIPPQKQKVILVKKVPLKTNESDDDNDIIDSINSDNDVEMDDVVSSSNAVSSTEKFVKFASTAEVHEIAPDSPHFQQLPRERNFKGSIAFKGAFHNNVAGSAKSRLGSNSFLHTTKKTYNLKAAANNNNNNKKSAISPVKIRSIRLKSDEILLNKDVPVHRRLGFAKNVGGGGEAKSMTSLTNRVSNVNISKNQSQKVRKLKQNNNSGSVFDRLGFN
ncbi:uncharacterized protein C19orf47 [Eurosta solidaginis]|uniref:uncharacterized protein C19orf47 n=1 Tax=Eurosta solidaginis TaxID=178769 RepID=UPI0035314B2B